MYSSRILTGLSTALDILIFILVINMYIVLLSFGSSFRIVLIALYLFYMALPFLPWQIDKIGEKISSRRIVKMNGEKASWYNILARYGAMFVLYFLPILMGRMDLAIELFVLSFVFSIITQTGMIEEVVSRTKIGKVNIDEIKI